MASDYDGPTALCNTCKSIDFASYFQPPAPGEECTKDPVGREMFRAIKLGLRGDLREKGNQCGFCHLAYAATDAYGVEDDTSISVSSFFCGSMQDSAGKEIPPAYYIRVTSDLPGILTTGYIQILESDAPLLGVSRDFRARVPRDAGFDMAQARRWLEICRTEHGKACDSIDELSDGLVPSPQPSDLLAVDLLTMRICNMPFGSDYLALSYCWPATVYLTLTKQTCEELFKDGALLARMHELPGTVQDAIKCAQELPFRYLWIDALCIVQDDYEQKSRQLRQMDRVYSCASLTLVCAYPVPHKSNDPCDGFPGLNKYHPLRSRIVRNVQGLEMVVTSPPIENYLQGTRWNTRCW